MSGKTGTLLVGIGCGVLLGAIVVAAYCLGSRQSREHASRVPSNSNRKSFENEDTESKNAIATSRDPVSCLQDLMQATARGDVERIAWHLYRPDQDISWDNARPLLVRKLEKGLRTEEGHKIREVAELALKALRDARYKLTLKTSDNGTKYYTVRWEVGQQYLSEKYKGGHFVTEMYMNPGWDRWVFVKVFDSRH
jgi:hypothetical protein